MAHTSAFGTKADIPRLSSDGSFPAGLKVHHDEYKVENEGDVVLLYRQLDERKSGRSVGDIAWAYQGVVQELTRRA